MSVVWGSQLNLRYRLGLLASLVLLAACTPKGELVSTTQCRSATALATYTWRVEYYVDRSNGGLKDTRLADFASTSLLNKNRQRPDAAVTGPDDQGVWWPALPPRPTVDEIDKGLEWNEKHDGPQLYRNVDYRLQCDDGNLKADAFTYRQAANRFREGGTVTATYSLGQILNANLPSPGSTPASP